MSVTMEDYSARVRTLELASQSNADRLEAHEDICAERYKGIHEGMRELGESGKQTNRYLIGIGIAMIAGLAKLVFFP